jgi:hypothetical protein
MMRLAIAAELAWRSLIELRHYLTQLRGFRILGGKTLSANFAQRADGGVSVFAADFVAQTGRSSKADVSCPMNGHEVTLLIIVFADHSDRAGHCSRTR